MKKFSVLLLAFYTIIYIIISMILKNSKILILSLYVINIATLIIINIFIICKFKYLNEIMVYAKYLSKGYNNQSLSIKGEGSFSKLAKDLNDIALINKEYIKDTIKSDVICTNAIREISENNNIDINELKSVLKKSKDNINLNKVDIDLKEFVNDKISHYEHEFNNKNLELKINLDKDNMVINSDKKILDQVFNELIDNIIKYSLEGTKVYIDIYKKEDNTYITLKNISKEDIDYKDISNKDTIGINLVKNLLAIDDIHFSIEIEASLFKACMIF